MVGAAAAHEEEKSSVNRIRFWIRSLPRPQVEVFFGQDIDPHIASDVSNGVWMCVW